MAETPGLPVAVADALLGLISEVEGRDLYELQEARRRAFRSRDATCHDTRRKHVHGELRDRGEAMVDLVDAYRAHGFELAARELPDDLLVVFESLSQVPDEDAIDLLADAMPIIALVGARLGGRKRLRVHIRRVDCDRRQAGRRHADTAPRCGRGPGPTIVQMDRIWEEETVTFMGNQGGNCGTRDRWSSRCARCRGRRGESTKHIRTQVRMMSYLNQLLFGVYPYVAGTVFLVGSLVRFDRDQFTWKAGSSQMLRQRNMVIASNLFHVGILGIFFGHLVGLLTPPEIFHALGVSPGAKQMLAVVAGGVFGLLCLVGLVMLVYRRLTDPRINATSTAMDIFVLLLLLAQLCLGLITLPVSLHHLDGANMLQLMSWARNIVTFDPSVAVGSLAGVGWLFKTHLLLGMTVFLVFPFAPWYTSGARRSDTFAGLGRLSVSASLPGDDHGEQVQVRFEESSAGASEAPETLSRVHQAISGTRERMGGDQ